MNKFKLPTVGRSYRSYQERLRASKKAVVKRRGWVEVTELAVLVVVAILIASLYGCGKEAKDGLPGPRGEAGPAGKQGAKGDDAIVAIIDPCGDSPTVIDEVLIILSDGKVLVSFSDQANGNNTRLSLLPVGSYVTTDGSNCVFTLHSDLTITY